MRRRIAQAQCMAILKPVLLGYLEAEGRKDEAPAGADDVHHNQEHGVFASAAVGAEQDQIAHAGGNERAGEHRRQLQCAFQIQLRNDHARRAVGDQADKRRTQDASVSLPRRNCSIADSPKVSSTATRISVTRKMNTDTCTVCEMALRIIDRTGVPSCEWE